MMNNKLPLFYFRPTIAWVDDDPIFLEAVKLAFSGDYNCITFDSSQKALDFLDSYESPLSKVNFKRPFTESDLFGIKEHYPVDLNMKSISDLLALPNKQQEIAVLVIDYDMPNINGLDLCKRLKAHPSKKMLLTGEATESKAIMSFNQKLIDKFVKKEVDMVDELKRYLGELQGDYFYDICKDHISHLETINPSPLTDPVFVNFFSQWCLDNRIEEFYLINRQGSFIAKDRKGDLSYFIVISEKDKLDFIKLNDELVEDYGYILSRLGTETIIPFFGIGKESWEVDVKDWGKYFYSAQILQGREKYYWACVNRY